MPDTQFSESTNQVGSWLARKLGRFIYSTSPDRRQVLIPGRLRGLLLGTVGICSVGVAKYALEESPSISTWFWTAYYLGIGSLTGYMAARGEASVPATWLERRPQLVDPAVVRARVHQLASAAGFIAAAISGALALLATSILFGRPFGYGHSFLRFENSTRLIGVVGALVILLPIPPLLAWVFRSSTRRFLVAPRYSSVEALSREGIVLYLRNYYADLFMTATSVDSLFDGGLAALATVLRPVGDLVLFAPPHHFGGEAFTYLHAGTHWRSDVEAALRLSRLAIIHCGDGESIAWEYRRAIEILGPGRVAIYLPPPPGLVSRLLFRDYRSRYERLLKRAFEIDLTIVHGTRIVWLDSEGIWQCVRGCTRRHALGFGVCSEAVQLRAALAPALACLGEADAILAKNEMSLRPSVWAWSLAPFIMSSICLTPLVMWFVWAACDVWLRWLSLLDAIFVR